MLVNSYRDRSLREDEAIGNDSDLSKNDALSQSRSFNKQNSKNRLKRHSFFELDRHGIAKQYHGDELLHNRKTNNNFFQQNHDLNKFYDRLSPINKKNNFPADIYNP